MEVIRWGILLCVDFMLTLIVNNIFQSFQLESGVEQSVTSSNVLLLFSGIYEG